MARNLLRQAFQVESVKSQYKAEELFTEGTVIQDDDGNLVNFVLSILVLGIFGRICHLF